MKKFGQSVITGLVGIGLVACDSNPPPNGQGVSAGVEANQKLIETPKPYQPRQYATQAGTDLAAGSVNQNSGELENGELATTAGNSQTPAGLQLTTNSAGASRLKMRQRWGSGSYSANAEASKENSLPPVVESSSMASPSFAENAVVLPEKPEAQVAPPTIQENTQQATAEVVSVEYPAISTSRQVEEASRSAWGPLKSDADKAPSLAGVRQTKTNHVLKQFEKSTIDVFAGFSDFQGISLTIIDAPKHGNVEIVDGKFVYEPAGDYFGQDAFVYQMKDLQGNVRLSSMNLTIECIMNCTQTFVISWNPNENPAVKGYHLYVGTEEGKYSEKITLGKVANYEYVATQKGEYYFTLSSYGRGSSESRKGKAFQVVF